MKFVQHSDISGELIAPPSKSIIQRKMIADFLCNNLNVPFLSSMPDDVITTYKALKNITNHDSLIRLDESGFCLRVIPNIASLFNFQNRFLLSDSLAQRPVVENLAEIGFVSNIEKLDSGNNILTVKGQLNAGVFHIDGSITSQLLTGLLFTLPVLNGDSKIYVSNLNSKSYVELTIEILKLYSIEVIHTDYEVFHIKGKQIYKNVDNFYEGDWSGASFLISVAATSSNSGLSISGLNFSSVQADRAILEILKQAGIKYNFNNECIYIEKSKVKSFTYDFSDCPDLVPAIIPIAIKSDDICILHGIDRLKFKESNRISALVSEYAKCGISITEKKGSLYVEPGNFVGTEIDSHNDHRIVMSLAVSALSGEGVLSVKGWQCVSKSYPEFWNDLIKIGASIYE